MERRLNKIVAGINKFHLEMIVYYDRTLLFSVLIILNIKKYGTEALKNAVSLWSV